MKKMLLLLVFVCPFVGISQQPWHKSSPLDYMWKNVGNAGFSAGEADNTCLAFSPSGEPYVVYSDYANSLKASVMKFDGANWVYVGNAGFSAGEANYTNLVFGPSGEPYVAYEDYTNSLRATVMKFNGTNWVNVGNAGFSVMEVWYTYLAFSPSGQLYIAFSDFSVQRKATVMKFDGSNWVYVGNAGFSLGRADWTSLAFDTSGQPYVAYNDSATFTAIAMKFNGTSWINVGNAGGFSVWGTSGTTLVFNTSGELYVGFSDFEHADGASVMKFDGTNWVYVGEPDFSGGTAWPISFALSLSGEPYMAYGYGSPPKATVIKFDGTEWIYVGEPEFSISRIWFISLAFNPLTAEPYVAYDDLGISKKATVMKYDSVYVGINNKQMEHLLIYPNPATTKINIDCKNQTKKINYVEILDTKGVCMTKIQTFESKAIFDVSNYFTGIYIVRVRTNESNYIEKFCKH
jgi:hypothetical protein